MKKILFQIWKLMPFWMQRIASFFVRPKYEVAVGAVIFDPEKKLLLCQHTYRREFPWGLPGGDIEPGEDPEEAVKREVWEETGFHVKETRLLFAENPKEYHIVCLIYLCTVDGGNFVPNEEISQIRFFDVKELPEFFPAHRATIDRALGLLS